MPPQLGVDGLELSTFPPTLFQEFIYFYLLVYATTA